MRCALLVVVACSVPPRTTSRPTPEPALEPALAIELVETQPIETTLDSNLPDAHTVWLQMIAGATRSIDLAEFYASNAPNSRLEPIVAALEAAAARGVRVRFLSEISFVRVYTDTLDRMSTHGIALRMLDLSTTTRGILHAKYFIVDGRDAYLGSQNFDWRSLEHIEELGARIREPALVDGLAAIFAADWALAGAEPAPTASTSARAGGVELVASPRDLVPPGIAWELPRLVALIAGARQTLRVQAMSYRATADDGTPWTELEAPLLAAAARGVHVEILLADWTKRPKTIGGLQRLARTPNIEIRLVTIPPWSGGFIPFARVIHAKLLVADGMRAWLGTGNWERDYFYDSRNVGLVIEEPVLAAQIARFSDATWRSAYATPLDPDATYTPPRIAD